MNCKKYIKRMLWSTLIVIVILFASDFGYSRYVASKLKAWEATVERNEAGVMVGCEADSDGDGSTAILLVHGINDTPYTWRKMAPELSKHFHVRTMRMPGFGEPIPVYAQKNSEDWIAAVRAEASELRKNHQHVFVVAHSLGGAVTIQTAIKEQQKIFDGIVLLAPAIEVSNRRSPLLPTRTWHNIASILIFTKTTYNPFGNDAQDPDEQNAAHRVQFTPRSIINETFKLIDLNRGHESEIDEPVLLVLSELDQVNDHEASEKWLGKIASQQKELFWNNESGHGLQYDLGWEKVTDKIIEFVNDHSD